MQRQHLPASSGFRLLPSSIVYPFLFSALRNTSSSVLPYTIHK